MGTKQLQQIAEHCQQGDREAFALLYTAMRQPLRAVCLGYVHDEAVADDLLHDAFLLIFLQIGKLKDTARAEFWMTMLTRRVSLLYLRKQRQLCQESLSSCAATALQSLTVENPAQSSLAVQEILAAVDALPEGYRRVFRLFVMEDMSHKDIADLLHIDPHSSASQLYHAKALLRRWLRPLVLLLLCVTVPMDIRHWHTSTNQTSMKPILVVSDNGKRNAIPSLNGSVDGSPTTGYKRVARNPRRDQKNNLSYGIPGKSRPLPIEGTDSCACPQMQIGGGQITDNGEHHASCVPTEEKVGDEIIPTKRKTCGDWLLTVTYSGMGNRGDMRLPFANAETNPMVYDSVAHHHRPLTVGLMLNHRLGDHWQLGAGLRYERMTSDMLSGNTYVALSQHQVVQYIGLPVSVSWHYPSGHRFSTYISLSTYVSLPLRSTLESVYIMDGQAYEPITERLHPAVQWSAGFGLGLQYNLTPHIGFFTEPGLYYHFQGGDDKIKTWNTEHPFDFCVPLGLRITF